MYDPILKKRNLKITKEEHVHWIAWEELEAKLGKKEYRLFCGWIYGQTTVPEGAYPDDVARFLHRFPILD